MNTIKRGNELTLTLGKQVWGGRTLNQVDGMAVFVPRGITGQTVRAYVRKRRRGFAEAKIIEVLEPSPLEHEIPYAKSSGGMYARVPLATQHEWKKEQVVGLFAKFADTDLLPHFDRFITSPLDWEYRNKMEYSFGPTHEDGGFGLGSKVSGQFWRVASLEAPGGLFDSAFERLMPEIRTWCEGTGLPIYDQRSNEGFWRNLAVRKSFLDDQFVISMVTTSTHELPQAALIAFLQQLLGTRLAGIVHTILDAKNDSIANAKSHTVLWGTNKTKESFAGLSFEVSPMSFAQPNPQAAKALYDLTAEYASANTPKTLLDMCCGTGTIGQILAAQMPDTQVIGVEIVPDAVADANANAEKNQLTNYKAECECVRKWTRLHEWADGPYSITLDPPRTGVHPRALRRIAECPATSLVYVSCNPATQARDLTVLAHHGWRVQKWSLVDQFPHTPHVESVLLLTKAPA